MRSTPPSPDPFEVVSTLARAMTTTLGDLPTAKALNFAAALLARQLEGLADIDCGYTIAFRAFVIARVRPAVPDDESLEKVLTHETDPFHPQWLAICPRHMLRIYAARVVAGPRPGAMGLLGTITLPGPGPEGE